MLHEMGHVLGIGTLWPSADLVRNLSVGNPGNDTHFVGPLAIAAFDAAGGTGYTGGEKVPVENNGQAGSADAHWRESVLGNELMTSGLNSGSNPLSAITIQSLAAVGSRAGGGDPPDNSHAPERSPARLDFCKVSRLAQVQAVIRRIASTNTRRPPDGAIMTR